MKGFVVGKMLFIFMYFIVILIDIKSELLNPSWSSFIHGSSATFCLLVLIQDVIEIIKKK